MLVYKAPSNNNDLRGLFNKHQLLLGTDIMLKSYLVHSFGKELEALGW